MKKLFVCLFVLLNAAFCGSAIAGQDQAVIQLTRKYQLAHDATEAQKPAASGQLASATTHLNLPLDHGPRAEVTPWVNQQRRLRAQKEAETKLAAGDNSQ